MDRSPLLRTRARALVALGVLVAVLGTPPAQVASAEPLVQEAIVRRHQLNIRLHRIGLVSEVRMERVARRIEIVRRDRERLSSPLMMGRSRWVGARRHMRSSIARLHRRMGRYATEVQRRRTLLRQERHELADWLAEWGIFRVCPVADPREVMDNFGATVDLPEVPVHVHMGNDILAPSGTPILAPFDGSATASFSDLGGLVVRVQGEDGYVFNAHLIEYGRLGHVRAGDVVGYVGDTGDATAPHDHFEWHPQDGAAIDPNPLLSVVC